MYTMITALVKSNSIARKQNNKKQCNRQIWLPPKTLTPLRISEPARSNVPPLGTRNEPAMRGEVSRPLCDPAGHDIVGLEVGVGMADEVGVGSIGEGGGETEVDVGGLLLSTSSLTACVGERSSTDGLLLGIGESHGL